jgi:predicted acyl esterase
MNPHRYAELDMLLLYRTRGTGSSEGDLYFWHQEYEDGYDSVEWLAGQPWCMET